MKDMNDNIRFAEADSTGGSLATGETDNRTEGQKNNQNQLPEWIGNLPDDLKDKNLGRFKEPLDLMKSYVELEGKLGKSIQIPGSGASQEEQDKFFKRIGRPDSPDGYELSKIKLPEGENRDETAEAEFAKEIFKQGYSKKQAQETWAYLLNMAINARKNLKKQQADKLQEAKDKLREDLGSGYDGGIKLMHRIVSRFADKEAREFLDEGMGNDPRAIRFLIAIGKTMSEDTLEGRITSPKEKEEKVEKGVLSYDQSPEMTGENRYRTIK